MLRRILTIYLILITNVWSSPKEYKHIWSDIYDPTTKVRDIVFDLQSKEIENLVKEKIVGKKIDNFVLRYYWIKNKADLEILNQEDLSLETSKIIKDEFKNKIDLVVGSEFDDLINGYAYEGVKEKWFVWKDPTALKDVIELKIKRIEKKIEIIQNKPTGSINTTYFFEKMNWSENKLVLKKIVKIIKEGPHTVQTEAKLDYLEKNGIGLPEKLSVISKDLLKQKGHQNYRRTVKTDYSFFNYKVNTSEALRWFSTR